MRSACTALVVIACLVACRPVYYQVPSRVASPCVEACRQAPSDENRGDCLKKCPEAKKVLDSCQDTDEHECLRGGDELRLWAKILLAPVSIAVLVVIVGGLTYLVFVCAGPGCG